MIAKSEKPKSLKHGGKEEPEEMSLAVYKRSCVPCVLCGLYFRSFGVFGNYLIRDHPR
jgi:hypothetical protein